MSSIETDVHLTRNGVPVLCHDAFLNQVVTVREHDEALPQERWLSRLTLAECRRFRVDRNPDPDRFPEQNNHATPLATRFADAHDMDPYTLPTLADFFAFADAYAGAAGQQTGKTAPQRTQAGRLRFDLELKRVPFEPHTIGDDFDGISGGLLERRVVEEIHRAGVLARTIVRSFDHRSVRAIKRLEPGLTGAVLIAGTAPVSAATFARDAAASLYCPEYRYLDEQQIRAAHDAGLRVIPWTVNRPEDWDRLVAWRVDGITTDFPDRLAKWLEERAIIIS